MLIKDKFDGIEIVRNFDWDMTRRKLCIFMPSFHDKKYTESSLRNIKTSVSKQDYIIIVGCDGKDQEFYDREDENIYYFYLNRKDKDIRNSCFIRNFCLKNCESEFFFQKDGDVVVLGDFIKSVIDYNSSGKLWRAGNIYVLNEEQTDLFLKDDDPVFLDSPTKIIDEKYPEAKDAQRIIYEARGEVNFSTYFQYAFSAPTNMLKSINGYDEDYTYYGYEDSDIFCRLYCMNHKMIPDTSVSAIHLCHPRVLVHNKISDMSHVFIKKDMFQPIRNQNGWGNGV